jgi:hypothetical protein
MQSVSEMSYEFIANMLRDAAGTQGMKFFPMVFSLFMFVLVANLLGMFPYFFTVTSHIIVTFALAMPRDRHGRHLRLLQARPAVSRHLRALGRSQGAFLPLVVSSK